MFYSNLLRNVILPIGDLIFGNYFSQNLKIVEKNFRQSEALIIANRNIALMNHLKFVLQKSTYYKELNLSAFNDPLIGLKQFPILTKDIIRNRLDNILTRNKESLICYCTSGSSGIQTNIYISKKEQGLIRAIQATWWKWAGFEMGEPMFQTGLATSRNFEKKLKDFFFRTNYQFAFGLTSQNTKDGLEWAKKKNPFLGGYASSLYILSELADGKGISMKSAVSWGDKLFDHYRKNIERVFNCNVYETYGTGEGLMLGAQKDLDYLYVMDPYFIIELLDDDGFEVADGEIGHVVVTSLIHEAMPLIRYKVGDLAIKLPRNLYPENREFGLSLFQKIIGRETDIVITPKGKKLIVHSFTGIFEYFPQVRQFCVIQSDINGITIIFIPGQGFNQQVLSSINEQLLRLVNEKFEIKFKEVKHIPNTASGKPQIIISNIKGQQSF